MRALFAGQTVEQKSVLYRNRSTGFDYVRLGLSLSVAFWHAFFLTYAQDAKHSMLRVLVLMILPMFFALSGYLISGSLTRTRSIHEFLTLRAIRIMPALAVEVVLSAVLVGVFFTTLPLGQYFSSPVFHAYFLNIVGDIHFFLPGVFEQNPTVRVNGSLWTIPYELYCYLAITLLWLVGAIRNRRLILLIVVVMQIALPARDLLRGEFIKYDEALPGRMLILSFLCGVLIYFYREKIVLRLWMFVAAIVLSLLLLMSVYTSYLVAFPAAYITVFIGLTNPRKIPILMDGDYSYGIYLYASPIQQSVLALFPDHRTWWFNFGVALVPFCLFAAFSWHVVESPILGRRRRIVALTDRVAVAFGGAVRRIAGRPAAREV
ncbi:MAG: acyltransferase family protein [Janthinobacterium lividum]